MKKLIAVLFIVIPAGLGFGQTNPMADRVERLSKRFPPEVAAPASDRPKLSRRYCVSPSLEKNSLTLKPCQPAHSYRYNLNFTVTPQTLGTAGK